MTFWVFCECMATCDVSYMFHTATHCNTLQHAATHCNTLQHAATHCNTLQHAATHCNTLQHTAVGSCDTPWSASRFLQYLLCILKCTGNAGGYPIVIHDYLQYKQTILLSYGAWMSTYDVLYIFFMYVNSWRFVYLLCIFKCTGSAGGGPHRNPCDYL